MHMQYLSVDVEVWCEFIYVEIGDLYQLTHHLIWDYCPQLDLRNIKYLYLVWGFFLCCIVYVCVVVLNVNVHGYLSLCVSQSCINGRKLIGGYA